MPSASPDSLAAAQRAYDLLNTDFPQVDAPSLAALRDALSASTSHFPPTAALVASHMDVLRRAPERKRRRSAQREPLPLQIRDP